MVQGVCFRIYTQRQAEMLGVSGWVRNRSDGMVEVIAEGEESSLQELLDWCQKGPSYASVETVRHEYSDALNEFEGFSITY